MPAAPFGPERLMLLSLALVLSLGACQEPDAATGPSMSQALLPTDTTLAASRDGYVTSKHPNRNGGAKDSMDVAQPLRSLVAFDQAQIAAAVGTGTLSKATLRLTIGRVADNWGPSGRTIDVHRVTVPWTEAGETYNCAIDSDPGNATKDCAGATEWAMASGSNPPWVSPRTAQALVTTTTAGTLEFDVTADVAAFLAGTPNEGWLLKKTDEDKQGRIVFLTKEGGAAPELVMTVSGQVSDTTRPVVPAYGFPVDSAYLSPLSSDSAIFFRRLLLVSFHASASGATINQVFSKYSAVVVGGLPWSGDYIVQVPDPGEPLDSLLHLRDRVLAEPGVEFVILINYRSPPPVAHARFPIDGSGFARESWSKAGGSDPLWGLKAIRAPLSWGCENGLYGSTQIDVSVVEWLFQPLFAGDDFPTVPRPTLFTATGTLSAPASSSQEASLGWHGTAVAGMLGARADNGKGVPGIMWGSRLHLYSLGRPTALPMDQVTTLVGEIIPRLAMDAPRVVNLSLELSKSPMQPGLAAYLAKQLQQLLTQVPSMLIVKATGNDGVVLTPASLDSLSGGGVLLNDALVRVRQAGFRDRVLMVGGSEQDYDGSGVRVGTSFTFIEGETDIVAPARGIRVLAGTPFAVGVVDTTGTSFAAPMVSGVAAQLLAMQPNLTPAEVKRYIVEGAQEPRIDPETGVVIGPEQLRLTRTGATQSVFQLDAYGALTLLSRSDPATPICGFPVITSLVQDSATGEVKTSVRLMRPGHVPEEVFHGDVENVTVAQGGRRIGIDWYTTSSDLVFQDNSWRRTSAGTFRGYRQFLERDTAFADYSAGGTALLSIRGPGVDRGPYDICAGLPMPVLSEYGPNCQIGLVASTGEWVHAVTDRSNSDITGCGPGLALYGSYLVPVTSTGVRQALREVLEDPCRPETGTWSRQAGDVVAWRADGAVAWIGQADATYLTVPGVPDPNDPNPPADVTTTIAMQTRFRQVSVLPGTPVLAERAVNGRIAYALGWRADGSSLISYEYADLGWSNCQRAVRAGLAPERELSDSAGPAPWCGNPVMEPLPASRFGAPLASALPGTRPGGARIPQLGLADRARHRATHERIPPPMVLVN